MNRCSPGKQAKMVCEHEAARVRRTGILYVVWMTLWIAAICAALSVKKLPVPDYVLPMAAAFLQALIGLWVNLPLMKALRKGSACVRPARLCWMPILALLPVPAALGMWKLLDYVNIEYMAIASFATATPLRTYLAIPALFLVIVVILYVFFVLGVFMRQTMILLIESEQIRAGQVGALVRGAFKHGFSPFKLFFCSIHWFLLMLLLFCASTLASYAFFSVPGGFSAFRVLYESTSLTTQVSLLTSYLLSQEIWLAGLTYELPFVLILGAGFYFWPRYQLKRVCYQRQLMKREGLLEQ